MLKVALIGAEGMGTVHARAYAHIRGAKLVGIVDSNREAAEKLGMEQGVPFYATLDELQAVEDPDVIDICLPTHLHKELVIKAAAMAKHIFCEKPIAASKADALEMIEACRNAGVMLRVGHVLRYSPDYVKAKALLDQQKLGKVGTVRMLREGNILNEAERRDDAETVDVILDLIILDIDWLCWTFGDVDRVYAKGLLCKEGLNYIQVFLSLRMKSGVIVHASGSCALPSGLRTYLEVAGRGGVMRMESDELSMPIMNTIKTDKGIIENRKESPLRISPYQAELQEFIDCLVNKQEMSISEEDTMRTLEVCLAAQRSLETGKAITL
jgi:UDP-N-acetylglucosamine 3-dehydrogenase